MDTKRNIPRFGQVWTPDTSDNAGRPCCEWPRVILFEWFARERLGYKAIAERLNRLGVKPQRAHLGVQHTYGGGYWSANTIACMATPTAALAYSGWYLWGKLGFKWLGERVKCKRRPPEEWQPVEDAHAPLITAQEAQAVIELRDERSREHSGCPRAVSSQYLLSGGVAKCAACGSNLVGLKVKTTGGPLFHYVCGSWAYRQGAGCAERFTMEGKSLEAAVVEHITSQFPMTHTDAVQWAQRVNAVLRSEPNEDDATLRQAQGELSEVEQQLANVVAAVKQGVAVTTLAAEAQRLEARRGELNAKLIGHTANTAAAPSVTPTDVLRWWQTLDTTLQHGTHQERKDTVRAFVESVEVNPREQQVTVSVWRYDQAQTQVFNGSPSGIRTRDLRLEGPTS